MSDLKPCPFCGGRAEKEGHDDLPLGRVKCRNCQIHTMWYANIDDAASVWNTRADSAALAAAVQAEREAIKEMIVRQHKVNVPDEQFRSGVHFACENLHAMIRSRGPAPAVDAKAARNEIWAADLVVTMDRLLHALEPCRGSDFGLETMESEQLEAAIADAKRALVPPTAALRALVSPTTGEHRRCTCDYDHVNDDEHRPWCGGPKPVRITEDEQREWKERFAAEDAETQRIVNEVQAIIDEAKDGGASHG